MEVVKFFLLEWMLFKLLFQYTSPSLYDFENDDETEIILGTNFGGLKNSTFLKTHSQTSLASWGDSLKKFHGIASVWLGSIFPHLWTYTRHKSYTHQNIQTHIASVLDRLPVLKVKDPLSSQFPLD